MATHMIIDRENCEIEAVDANGKTYKVRGYQARTILDNWDGEDPDKVREAVIAAQNFDVDLEKLMWR